MVTCINMRTEITFKASGTHQLRIWSCTIRCNTLIVVFMKCVICGALLRIVTTLVLHVPISGRNVTFLTVNVHSIIGYDMNTTGVALNYASVFIWKVSTVSFHKNTLPVSIKIVHKITSRNWNSLKCCVKHLILANPISIPNMLVFREIDKSNAWSMWNDPNIIWSGVQSNHVISRNSHCFWCHI